MGILKAKLRDGTVLEYLEDPIGEGGEKIVHFTADKKYVVAFYKDSKDANDPERYDRLLSILTKYNPITDPKSGAYYKDLFCWPQDIVEQPILGVVSPVYSSNFFFKHNNKEKSGKWFIKRSLRNSLPKEERGNWLNYLQISILLSRAVSRMHNAGLAHSDLSCNNVLIDPSHSKCSIIDIDSLVVPGMHPPKVIGTRGYIAPEVLAGSVLPSIRTDLYALAVLIYQYFFMRHPLEGPKVYSTVSAEEDEMLSMGKEATFIEHSIDKSNSFSYICNACGQSFSNEQYAMLKGKCNCGNKLTPYELPLPYTSFGTYIEELFRKSFETALKDPDLRPTATEWETGLVKTTDLILPCSNPNCEGKWFVHLEGKRSICPFCKTAYNDSVPVLRFFAEKRRGQYFNENHRLVAWNGVRLYKWHIFDNIWPGIGADKTQQGYITKNGDRWYLTNASSGTMKIINQDKLIYPGQYFELQNGMQILLSTEARGRVALVEILN
ncbi:MAG: serine/threonine protein kinase [Bacillota bacterium]|nr:serine/threonine protein kinase [Bacillota bacterium]